MKGYGRQNRHKETYRATEYTINYLPMIRIDMVVTDEILDQAVKVLSQSAATGSSAEGRILVSEVKEAACVLAAC